MKIGNCLVVAKLHTSRVLLVFIIFIGLVFGKPAENVEKEKPAPVLTLEQKEKIKALGLEVLSGDFAKVTDFGHIIHDADKVFQVMFEIL